jgi:hypothetical protein
MSEPNKLKTLAQARTEMAKFGITAKVSTLLQAKRLLRAKRPELIRAAKSGKPNQPTIPAYPKEHQPPTKPHKPVNSSGGVTNQQVHVEPDAVRACYNRQITLLRGESVRTKAAELTPKSDEELRKINDILARAIQTLCKVGYREGILLSRAHMILQAHPLTKDLDPRHMLRDIEDAQLTKQKKEAERASVPSFRINPHPKHLTKNNC